jgi:histone deacetylase 11
MTKHAFFALTIAALMLTLAGCGYPDKSSPPVNGRPVNGRVAIVYSKDYQIVGEEFRSLHIHPKRYFQTYEKLVSSGLMRPEDAYTPEPVSEEQILSAHSPELLKNLKDPRLVAYYAEVGSLDTLSPADIDRRLLAPQRCMAGGTLLAARLALKYGVGINLGGGNHHALPDNGGGFCFYNDIAIAINTLRKERIIKNAMVVDLDCHHGNGTAVIFKNDPAIFTFDMYAKDLYPGHKEFTTKFLSRNIPLAPHTTDAVFMGLLEEPLKKDLSDFKPQIVFYLAGADVLSGDPLGNQSISEEGLIQRDVFVVDLCVQEHIPVVMVLAGGYRDDAGVIQHLSISAIIESLQRK